MLFSFILPSLLAAGSEKPLGTIQGPGSGIFNPPADASGVSAAASLEAILSLLIGFMTVLAGIAFILYFLFAALQWVTAGGDAGKVEKARTQMFNGAVGLIVIIISYGIIAVIGKVLGLDLLNPGDVILNTLDPTK